MNRRGRKFLENDVLDERTFIFDGLAVADGKQGVAQVDNVTMTTLDSLASLHVDEAEWVPPGDYVRLKVNGETMMSNTPMEKRTNLYFVERAKGDVLIAGLGLGMILGAVLKKPTVNSVTVVEKYQDVIDLVAKHHGHFKLTVVQADIHEYTPAPHARFDTIYFDIWPNSNVEHLPEMEALRKQFRPWLRLGGWINSWTYDKLCTKRRSDAYFLKTLPRRLYRSMQQHGRAHFMERASALLTNKEIDEETKTIVRNFIAAHNLPGIPGDKSEIK